ncbi:MAG TPA: bifunctional methylenetetrahydrofolate dehydrogenase/methenyltetrahydrofolate cyclohydrolase FolD [Rectinema sp.]|jgi:methylenetetrahydrofolate dehydrogenase (NADP+)/methenyltetrahydrofolate cyclohydrolase|nr:bifunctional methylenetetrahydrofolate dehydrogenase/methenyltetrahydrofolate cyclohydrolase FolD [Spirochaetia bacterium]HNV18926.1 bifunctional methylenetetrahydrofolate dehydrogenase/methenyltetrahydrofolate cyclohydrolase FolD [Rectinema sp.]HOH05383.1 bifunctional methylenetetrahydrofolate dehydrogenase/methenyltetrahydrofolate cyclohydrolase FolD [Rectinema sp.]HOM92668.1 bifunctional methylenetetrahydrofolate dehydrogenase/methenyltetrahydrofolate cyclohydrolase FolD [Rectinema sp.]HO
MSAVLIDGKRIAEEIRDELVQKVILLKQKGVIPGLAVILVGDNPASISYVTAKEKACAEIGMKSFETRMAENTSEETLLERIAECNRDPNVHGILVQLPLPRHIDEHRVIEAIDPNKDVDGFTPVNLGRMLLDQPCFIPCTPFGIIELLKRSGVPTNGARAVVVGRSNIVGKPLANLFLRKSVNATVTVCHTGTRDLGSHVREADIVVACAGAPGLVSVDMIKPGACIIDVGVNRVPDSTKKKGYRLCGDVDFEGASQIAGWITPVPGGVGPMTITMLLSNTIDAAARISNIAL